MKQSPTIAALAAALVKAQGEFSAIAKDSTNPHFRNKYASLDAIIEKIRSVLAQNDLAVVQGMLDPLLDAEGNVTTLLIETTLVHKSGEFITNLTVIPIAKLDPQGAGAALTYGRRYGLSSILSLATEEDDDANSASEREERQPRSQTRGPARVARSTRKAAETKERDPEHDRVLGVIKAGYEKLTDEAQATVNGEFVALKAFIKERGKDLKADRTLADMVAAAVVLLTADKTS